MTAEQVYLRISDTQEKLLDYWHSHIGPCGCAPRSAINPGKVRGLLSNISIVELSQSGHSTFRLAGSKLREIVGVEARGRSVSSIQGGELEPWCDAILSVLDSRAPVSGQTIREDGLVHMWLRLPLLDRDGNLTQVMCHDQLISPDKLSALKCRYLHELTCEEPEQGARVAA